ncbi:uncharacterized protein FIBRA_00874 [Fibroporia radiculosa]|uniref:ATP-binding cassette transporter n=1 Tax=Fibroporia radiculosa TaxID=599839 RepID=J4HSC2_9APHY|nr:uncharacterized protein FIBRA_00874 [Fibroporia radiculosa]CCL98867.1 predicted protein [Fibroporia radiculosa]
MPAWTVAGRSNSSYSSSQIVLAPAEDAGTLLSLYSTHDGPKNMFLDSLAFPSYAAAWSIIALLLQLGLQRLFAKLGATRSAPSREGANEAEVARVGIGASSIVSQPGDRLRLALNIVRFLACLALFGMSAFSAYSASRKEDLVTSGPWLHLGLCGTYAYASILALVPVLMRSAPPLFVSWHRALVLLSAWVTYIYRDIWPLGTSTLSPLDTAEGVFLWGKLTSLTIAAVLVPLIAPRRYVPLDPKNPSPPAPEQTASILSLLLYSFLDKTVFEAYRMSHYPFERLPPLADHDSALNLVKNSFPELDPLQTKKDRHIFWGLLKVFRTDITAMVIALLTQMFSRFAAPLGIKNLLAYVESRDQDTFVRPWVWILFLLIGPALFVIFESMYTFLWTRMLVRLEAVITQLVFEHALRMRVKADVSDTPTTVTTTPDSASVAEIDGVGLTPTEGQSTSSTLAADADSKMGKQKDKDDAQPRTKQSSSERDKDDNGGEKSKNVAGRINNLITTDLAALALGQVALYLVVRIPLELALCVWFLYTILGVSAFAGMAVIVIAFPVPGAVASKIRKVEAAKMQKTDARVQSVTESLGVIRMIKLFGWEPRLTQQLTEKREAELKLVKWAQLWNVINNDLNYTIPLLTMVVTFVTYTIVMKQKLSASIVFSSMTVFDMFSNQLRMIFTFVPDVMRTRVALDRINEFMQKTELLDQFTERSSIMAELIQSNAVEDSEFIGFRNAWFTWTDETNNTSTPAAPRRKFTLRIEDELRFQRGSINIIVGPTGSGKTSLLMALLGEMHYMPSGPDSLYNLPRERGVAFAAQESWIQNETIRDNILFGSPYDEERLNKVLDQCGLKQDLELFEAGDLTESKLDSPLVTSGGQKARVTLARAVYSSAEILILDDVLAALDVHTARWIVEKCFKGDLIRGRTVLLVTHNVAMASPISDFVVSVAGGRISSQGTLSSALEKDKTLAAELANENEIIGKVEQNIKQTEEELAKTAAGKLIVEEEISEGHVSWAAMKLYLGSLGGEDRVLFWVTCAVALAITEVTDGLQVWFLGYWARQYEERNSSEVSVPFYVSIYSAITVVSALGFFTWSTVFVLGTLRASRQIHKELISSLFGTTLRWLDRTPTSRVLTRCTQDIDAIDGVLSRCLSALLNTSATMSVRLAAVVISSPVFVFPGIIIATVGRWIGQIYMKAQLSVKRERSNARAPVLGHFGAAFAGLVSIRAYGAQDHFRKGSRTRIDKYTRASITFYNLNRWIAIRIDMLAAVFTSTLAAYLVYGGSTASKTGFALNMAASFGGMILFWIRIYNRFEVYGNSLERIQQYIEIEQEPKPTESGAPPAYWPASGDLRVENLSARYSSDGPRVLEDVSFEIKSGERVGIVGRTGSGKSSLTLALLRCIVTEGKVYYDGIPTDSLNLDALRSHITIIPQVPELLSGTLRQNLDPFEQYDDIVLNDALRSAGLFALQSDTEEGCINLDSQISNGGGNLSVGQRQILALARAIVRQSKLLILDEATSAIDYATDAIIQESLRKELNNGVTLLTVAHRLQTIMDADRIMVLDAGRIVEFGKPYELLQKEAGRLRALVDESGDKDRLYAMASESSSPAVL